MPSYKESNRFLYLTTPLGEDMLLLEGFKGYEALNHLFSFELTLKADNSTTIDFDKLIGQKVSFGIIGVDSTQTPRHFNGTVTRFAQGVRDEEFTGYEMTVAPDIWKLTRKFRSRIFQHINIPDILKKVFEGFEVSYEFQGTYEQREYCVQYQETDMDFASRLMEEEGIYYFFKFTQGAHKLVLADTPQSHPDIPGDSKLIYEEIEGGLRDDERISEWQKAQYWGSGKYLLWDHHFELPHKKLDADKIVIDSVQVGKVGHKLKLAGNEEMEVYRHRGRYAQRFDGIDKSGGEKPADLQKIFQDNKRTVGIRMQQTETPMLLIHAGGNCWQITSGHKFTLQRHFNADGVYVVLEAHHEAKEGSFRSGDEEASTQYGNTFSCMPFAPTFPFRPPMVTERPRIPGPVSAIVVGPDGEEIFTDKYGRVKVQFHWDREGKNDADSSCWVRVGTMWAGQGWGSIHIPRIGQEVLVSFLEGDADHPVIVGSLYNPDQMPPYRLPEHKTVSTIKSRSTKQGSSNNFNEIRFEDLKGHEQVFLHAERDMDMRVKRESREIIGANRHMSVGASQSEDVGGDKHSTVAGNYTFTTGRDQHLTVGGNIFETTGSHHEKTLGGNHIEMIGGNRDLTIAGNHTETVGGNVETTVGSNHAAVVGNTYAQTVGNTIHLQAGANVVIEAGTKITLMGPGGFITIDAKGISIQGTLVTINSGGAPGQGPGANPKNPKQPPTKVQDPKKPDHADDVTRFGKM